MRRIFESRKTAPVAALFLSLTMRTPVIQVTVLAFVTAPGTAVALQRCKVQAGALGLGQLTGPSTTRRSTTLARLLLSASPMFSRFHFWPIPSSSLSTYIPLLPTLLSSSRSVCVAGCSLPTPMTGKNVRFGGENRAFAVAAGGSGTTGRALGPTWTGDGGSAETGQGCTARGLR